MSGSSPPASRVRREPPPFRAVTVHRAEAVTPRLRRVTLAGDELAGLRIDESAASVRVLLPPAGADELVVPRWTGNEFLLPDGRRPVIRTLTPRRLDTDALTLDLEIVVHGEGAASQWAATAVGGMPAAVSGPARGYAVDPAPTAYLLVGDETAIPAISQLLEVIAGTASVDVRIEIADPVARALLPPHPGATVTWVDAHAGAPPGDALVDAVRAVADLGATRVWAAGEAAAMQRIRRHLFEDRGLTRSEATVRGYWKHGRRGDADSQD